MNAVRGTYEFQGRRFEIQRGGLVRFDGSVPVSFQVTGAEDVATGPPVPATAIRPTGERTTSFVASVPIPQAGSWRLKVTTADGRFTALMPHPERVFRSLQLSWHPDGWGEQSPWMRLFRNARRWLG